MCNTWRPTAEQRRVARWAAHSVGYVAPWIDADDLQQVALLAIWKASQQAARADGSVVPDGVIARSACLNYLHCTAGRPTSAKRHALRATASSEEGVELRAAGATWDTPDRILEAKQALAGFCGMRQLHAEVLADFVDGDLTRLEIAARHGVTGAMIDKISDMARKVIAFGVPTGYRSRAPRKGTPLAARP